MDWKRFQQLIMTLPNAKPASGGQFVNCRCQNCFDSLDPTSAHMYVYIPWKNEKLPWYYCHKCNASGNINHKTLIEWGIYDRDVGLDLANFIHRFLEDEKIYGHYPQQSSIRHSVMNSVLKEDKKTEYKRRYISSRMGIDLSLQDLSSLKIVVNLWDFLKQNNITQYTRDINIINDIDREFIGFLSIDNSSLNMRRTIEEGHVYKSIDKRYVNYNIFGDKGQRFYTIPTSVNLMQPNRIKLHIAEGPMDILSIYLNLRQREEGIYTSVAGSNYLPVILYFLQVLRVPNIELHIYPDNGGKEGSPWKIKQLIANIPDPGIPVFEHRNMYQGEKDFGVPRNRITERIVSRNSYY